MDEEGWTVVSYTKKRKKKVQNTIEVPTEKFLVCRECGNRFMFSIDEQIYFNDRKYKPPRRCKNCRKNKKELSTALASEKEGLSVRRE